MPVLRETRDGCAILTIDNPPVNALSLLTRRCVYEAVEEAEQDDTVRAIIVAGAGRMFSAGAEIREFDTKSSDAPTLSDVIARVEGCSKPVVAAVQGRAMGGGLELALGAHYRIIEASALVALPEVKLGLIPGAGGTQRLPRALGLETALNLIVSGASASASDSSMSALFDRVVGVDVVEAALRFVAEALENNLTPPRLRNRTLSDPNAAAFLAFARANVGTASPGSPAPSRCVDAVAAAFELPFDRGLALEREMFTSLKHSPEAKALRHAFLAERAARKVADIGVNIEKREVRTVGVVGAGTMGTGISMAFLDSDMPVTLLETTQDALDRGVKSIHEAYERSVQKGRMTATEAQQRLGSLKPTLSYDALGDADVVVEAVFEDYGVKESVFGKLDAVTKRGAILATNTSTLDVNRIAHFTSRPNDVVGLHFFSPARVMKLLEIVRGRETGKDVLASALALAKKIRKTAVVAGVCDGFIGNRMLQQYVRQAGFLLDEGALPHEVDTAIEQFGFAMGPFRVGDLAGNDIGWAIRKRRYAKNPQMNYSKAPDLLCELGRFGQKTGKGWYDYHPGDRRAYPSPEVEALVRKHSETLRLQRRSIGKEEIVERLVLALVNEGARILAEGIAAKAGDIDVVYLSGYGFPSWRGGPMFYADHVGLYNVLASMRRFAGGYQGQSWHPAPLLTQLAKEGATFHRRTNPQPTGGLQ